MLVGGPVPGATKVTTAGLSPLPVGGVLLWRPQQTDVTSHGVRGPGTRERSGCVVLGQGLCPGLSQVLAGAVAAHTTQMAFRE